MVSSEIKNLPVHERMEHFYRFWEMHKRAGDFEVSQEAADRLAAMCDVPSPRVKVRDDDNGPRGRLLEAY